MASLGLSLPVVVKPCSGGSSIGVYIVNTEEEYNEALEKSFRYEDELVIEEYVKGREFACGIIDDKALPPIEIIPKQDFLIMQTNIRLVLLKKSARQISAKKFLQKCRITQSVHSMP